MKILYLANMLPYPPHDGGRIRGYHLLRALAAEHDVSLLAAAPDEEVLQEFKRLNPRIRFLRIHYQPHAGRVRVAEAARERLERETFDAVHVAQVWQWPGSRALGAHPVVLDADNVDTVVHRRLRELKGLTGPQRDLVAVDALEKQAYRRADEILMCADGDAERARAMAPGAAVTVIPNGVDPQLFPFRPERTAGAEPLFSYIGLLSYSPNADALCFFVREIWPLVRTALPGARFRIVGRYPPAEVMALAETAGVEVVPDVPEIQPYFQEADVLVVPLRAGSGTRLKILEALASGTPVVTTPLGCEGLAVEHGKHLYIAEEPAEFARQAVWVATHHEQTQAVRERGRRLVEERYGWDTIGAELRGVFARLAAATAGRAGS
jgi:glycosyltransferase involved in cell wall biosynthesis